MGNELFNDGEKKPGGAPPAAAGPPAVTPEAKPPATAEFDKTLAEAERRSALAEKAIKIALSHTNANDWARYPKPKLKKDDPTEYQYYLDGSGAQKLIKAFGIQISNTRSYRLDREADADAEDGRPRKSYIWVYEGTVAVPLFGVYIEGVQGRCTSTKAFFAKAHGTFKSLAEIDETYIMADAQSDFFRQAVSIVLGLKNPTEEALTSAGVKIDKIPAVEHATGYHGGGSTKPASEKQIDFVVDLFKKNGYLGEAAAEYLKKKYKVEKVGEKNEKGEYKLTSLDAKALIEGAKADTLEITKVAAAGPGGAK